MNMERELFQGDDQDYTHKRSLRTGAPLVPVKPVTPGFARGQVEAPAWLHPCCANERRDNNGGCVNCGDPCI